MFKTFLIQLEAEFLLMLEEIKRYWLNNLVGAFVDLVYFYAIFVAVQNLAPRETLSGTSSLVLMYAVLQLVLGFYTTISFTLNQEAVRGTLEHFALARGGLLYQLFLRITALAAYILVRTVFLLFVLLLATRTTLVFSSWWLMGVGAVLLTAVGLSLLLGALALYFKQIGSFFTLVQFLLIPYFLSFIQWQPYMAYLPFAPGAHLVRLGLTGGEFDQEIFLLALLQGLLLFGAGLWAMAYMYRLVRRRGILGRF